SWNRAENKRSMPWKNEKDAYKIWLSEIILQQTRVEQGLLYYERFVQTYPSIEQLAAAPEKQVFKLWEGLGYYSRCKNLISTARFITRELKGSFPKDYSSILNLKGIGPYTASAIASFAYNLPHAVLDGNVFRVLSRIYDKELPIDTTAGKKYFSMLAQNILPKNTAGEYNQAIMDFGATLCKPSPECEKCFFNTHCKAFLLNRQLLLPVKSKKLKIKERWFNYIVLKHADTYAIKKRTAQDIWQNLFEFLLIETVGTAKQNEILDALQKSYFFHFKPIVSKKTEVAQQLTHQRIYFSFFEIELTQKMALNGFNWVAPKELSDYPFPKTVQLFIQNTLLQ
ncbi:MAG: A/G-specific adenine glycosylase, partial [Chitinophagaceae bacterium]